jgi:hypothetical protein
VTILKDAALQYAAHGWPVLPLHTAVNGRCSCGNSACSSPGKHPRTEHGLKDATTDTKQVTQWWSQWPDANIGIRTGSTPDGAGVFVFDIDPRHNGDSSLAELVREYGELPDTVEAVTGSGGSHQVYSYPAGGVAIRNAANVRPGIDVRGDGGYIVVEPSLHVCGGTYAWKPGRSPRDMQPAEAPAWLLDLLQEKPATAVCQDVVKPAGGEMARLLEAASLYIARAGGASEGARNNATFNLAGHLAAFEVEGGGLRLTEGQILDLMRGWNLRNSPPLPESELKKAVGSAMVNGTPRQVHAVVTPASAVPTIKSGTIANGEMPWEPPAPLGEFDLPPFPLEAFPGELSGLCEFCAAAAESYQVPVDLVAMLVMATGGATLAKTIEVHVRGDHIEPVNLFTATAMPPGSRKSAIFRIVTQPLADFERQEIERLKPAIERSRNERAILEESLMHAQKQAARTRDAQERADYERQARQYVEQLSQHEDLKAPQYIGDDATPESVAKLLYDNGGRFALMSPEGDVFDLMAGRYSSTGTPNLGVYLKGHAGDDIRVNRVNRDRQVQYVRKPALTIGLAVQPDVIRGLAGQKGFRGRGLLGRFLYSLPESCLGHRKTITRPVEKTILAAYSQLILNAVQLKSVLDSAGWPTPLSVTIDDAGLAALNDFAVDVEKNLRAGGEFESMGDWAGKLVGAVCRIAGIMHGLTHVGPQGLQNLQIDLETILGAIAIGEYLVPHAKAAFFEMGADPSIDIARKVLRWVEDEKLSAFSRRDAFNQCRGTVHKVTEIDEPLRLLSGHGYIREQERQRDGPGRKPSQNYDVNPLWLTQNTHNSHNSHNIPLTADSAHSAQCAQEVEG